MAKCIYLTCVLELLKKLVYTYEKKTIQKYGILPLNLLVTLEGILSRRYDLGGSGRYLLFGFVCPSCDPLRRMCCCLLPCWSGGVTDLQSGGEYGLATHALPFRPTTIQRS
jgi:hypothetical protein